MRTAHRHWQRASFYLLALSVAFLPGCDEPTRPEPATAAVPLPTAAIAGPLTPDDFSGYTQIPDGVFSSGPAATQFGSGLALFGRGLDGQLYNAFWGSDGGYSSWQPLHGGTFSSKPSATSWGVNRLAVVGRGTNNSIYINVTTTSGAWMGWQRIPGATLTSAPAISLGSRFPTLYVIARKSDNRYYYTTNNVASGFSNLRWTTWRPIPNGLFKSEPAAALVAHTLTVVGKGLDDRFYRSTFNGTTWSPWTAFPGGIFQSGPAIVSNACHVHLFGQGLDNVVWFTTSSDCGRTWRDGFAPLLIGTTNASPAATIRYSGASSDSAAVELLVRGEDNFMWRSTSAWRRSF